MKVVGDCHWEVFTNEVNKKSFSLSYDYNVVLNDQAANCVVAALGMNSPRELFNETFVPVNQSKEKTWRPNIQNLLLPNCQWQ